MNLEGQLELGRLPGVLRELHVGRRTGVLRMVGQDATREVHWREGRLQGATSSLQGEDLGQRLVDAGLVEASEVQRARHLVAAHGLRVDEALLELQALEAPRLAPFVVEHTRDLLLSGFAGEGHYGFQPTASEPGEAAPSCELSTGQVVLDTVRRLDDPDVVRYGLGELDRLLVLSSDPLLRAQKLELTPTDGYVLSRVDGSLSAREIVQLTPLPAEDVLRALLGLVSTGLLELRENARPARPRPATATPAAPLPVTPAAVPPSPPPAPATIDPAAAERRREVLDLYASLRERTHFELLELPRDASEADVKAAYFRQAKRFHPDHHDPALADLRDKLEAIFIRVGQAYDTLKNVHARRAYEARLPRLPPPPAAPASAVAAPASAPPKPTQAAPPPPVTPAPSAAAIVDSTLRKAEDHLMHQRYWDAIQAVESVLPQAEGRARQRARVMLARALLKNPHWVRRAEETLLLAAKDEPPIVDAFLLLGALYKERNLRARALSMYRKAVELKPEHEEALAQLAELTPPPEEEPPPDKPGLLKKFFGRKP